MKKWLKGREEQRKFYGVKLGTKTNILSTLTAVLVTLILFLPLVMVFYQFIFIYGYERLVIFFYIIFVWIGVMCFNAVLNYLSVRFAKALEKQNEALQAIEEKYVVVYQLLNPGFAFAALAFIVFIAFQLGGL